MSDDKMWLALDTFARLMVAPLAAALMLAASVPARAQKIQAMPDDAALQAEIARTQERARTTLKQLGSGPGGTPGRLRAMPAPSAAAPSGIDPGELAARYAEVGKVGPGVDRPQLLVFVSVSMPAETLKLLSQQTKRAGGVLVFRGLKYGMKRSRESIEAMKPAAAGGAEIQIHPALFRRYSVTAAPTVVIAMAPGSDCDTGTCAAQSAAIAGDVSLDYALQQLAGRSDDIADEARRRLARMDTAVP